MIHYHGSPITPAADSVRIIAGRHAMVSFAAPEQIALAAEVCQSFALDNGAFSMWRKGITMDSWQAYYDFVTEWGDHPAFDFALIPDVIDGTEDENDALIGEWPFDPKNGGVPIWHLHENLERLERLCDLWPRVAIGSSGKFVSIGTAQWWKRMSEAMGACCDSEGRPRTKLHGLRMLDPAIFTKFPFASADSTNIARNLNLDSRWKGTYQPISNHVRGIVMADRIESHQSPRYWEPFSVQCGDLFTAVTA